MRERISGCNGNDEARSGGLNVLDFARAWTLLYLNGVEKWNPWLGATPTHTLETKIYRAGAT
jgi:hypothetical protein